MMDSQTADKIIEATRMPRKMATLALAMLALFLAILSISTARQYHYIGSGVSAGNTIQVSGQGELFAVPDTAEFSYTVQETAKDVNTAQAAVTKRSNDILAYLKGQGIDEKDIQTTDYSAYPQYEYNNVACVSYPCPNRQTLTGYQVSQTTTVKVRDTSKAGTILAGVGSKNVSQISGLNFTVADQKKLERDARAKAIADAREQADVLAKDLGVQVVRVVSFNEGGGGQMYYAKAMSAGIGGMADSAVPAPQISTGQNKITSNVTITYEIR